MRPGSPGGSRSQRLRCPRSPPATGSPRLEYAWVQPSFGPVQHFRNNFLSGWTAVRQAIAAERARTVAAGRRTRLTEEANRRHGAPDCTVHPALAPLGRRRGAPGSAASGQGASTCRSPDVAVLTAQAISDSANPDGCLLLNRPGFPGAGGPAIRPASRTGHSSSYLVKRRLAWRKHRVRAIGTPFVLTGV